MAYSIERIDVRKDRSRLLDFWERHGDKPLDEKFEWMYVGNPHGDAAVWLLIDDEHNEVVGCQAFFPRRFIHEGQEIRGGAIGDLLVAPEHRALGPAVKLNRAVKGILDREADLILSFPNKKAQGVQIRVGFKRVAPLERLVLPVRSARLLQRKGVPAALSSVVAPVVDMVLKFRQGRLGAQGAQSSDQLPEGVAELWQRIGTAHSLFGVRDEAYLTWKYEQDVDDRHHWVIVPGEDGPVAAAVYRIGDGELELRDVLFDGGDMEAGRKLVAEAARIAAEAGANSVVVNLPATSSLVGTLQALGFTARGRDATLLACPAKGREALLDCMRAGGGAHIVVSDQDT